MLARGLICLILVAFTATNAIAFYDFAGDTASFNARLAVDLGTGFIVYPKPEELYPEQGEGVNSLRFRLLCDAGWGESARLELNAYQVTRSRLHSAIDQASLGEPYRCQHLERTLSDTDDYLAVTGLDQASLKLYADPVEFVIGRQPIGLANNFIFTPNDLFYPFGATEVDREFRPGVDSLRLNLKTGELSGLDLIMVMGYDEDDCQDWDRSAALTKGTINWEGTEFCALAGKADGRYLAGLAVSAEALGLGWRLEGNYSRPTTHTDDPYVQISAGFDKRWANSAHLVIEYYYHGNGQSDPKDYLSLLDDPRLAMDPFMGRNYVGLTLLGDPTPVFTLQAVALVNLDDGSSLFSPSVTYKAADEIEFILSAQLPYGQRTDAGLTGPDIGSEYGLYPRSVTLLGRMYF